MCLLSPGKGLDDITRFDPTRIPFPRIPSPKLNRWKSPGCCGDDFKRGREKRVRSLAVRWLWEEGISGLIDHA